MAPSLNLLTRDTGQVRLEGLLDPPTPGSFLNTPEGAAGQELMRVVPLNLLGYVDASDSPQGLLNVGRESSRDRHPLVGDI